MVYITQHRIGQSEVIDATAQISETKADIGSDFILTNQDNTQVAAKDFNGRLMLVFFGFTRCPDICPVTTATYAKILELLGDKASSVAPIFISVDPANDTPEVLKKYLANFDSRIIGLTGTDEQIKQVTNGYKAFYSKHDDKMDHSGYIYLMDKSGVYTKHFAYDASAEEITAAITELLK